MIVFCFIYEVNIQSVSSPFILEIKPYWPNFELKFIVAPSGSF